MNLIQLGFLAVVLPSLIGCGTLHNLNDRPDGPQYMFTGRCTPFGGVTRSSVLAVMGPPCGAYGIVDSSTALSRGEFDAGFKQLGGSLLLGSAGLVAIADTPLSLAGDILTFPIAYARSNENPWFTWWGEKSWGNWRDNGPAPAEDNQRTHGGIEPLQTTLESGSPEIPTVPKHPEEHGNR